MLREVLYGQTQLGELRNALDAYAARHRSTASNIANSESQGYKPTRVTFEDRLAQALGNPSEPLSSTNPRHMPMRSDPNKVKFRVVKDDPPLNTTGINKVDMERELTHLATNQMQYRLTLKQTADLFSKMRQVSHLP